MPIYEYFCPDCHTKFSSLRSMADADVPLACEHCGEARSGRVFSVFYARTSQGAVAGGGGGCACGGGGCGCAG